MRAIERHNQFCQRGAGKCKYGCDGGSLGLDVSFPEFWAYVKRVFPVLDCRWAAGAGKLHFDNRDDKGKGFTMVGSTLY
jgi:hypothetical protein